MVQVPFVAMCDHGHIQDFPWREWVHRSGHPACRAPIRLVATGGTSLSAQTVMCECGAHRTLVGIMEGRSDGTATTLSSELSATQEPYLCRGASPWLGDTSGKGCTQPIRGSLRSASNLYFADVRSAIYLPREAGGAPDELISFLETPAPASLIQLLSRSGHVVSPADLRGQFPDILYPFTDEQIQAAIGLASGQDGPSQNQVQREQGTRRDERALRLEEYAALRQARDEEELVVEPCQLNPSADLLRYLSQVSLIKKLRETRALAGFSRVFSESALTLEQHKAMLRKQAGQRSTDNWLPAYVVHGEGIFLEFNLGRLRSWENLPAVTARIQRVVTRYLDLQQVRRLRDRDITPRFILIHTLAHVLINELTYECGYSSASLRERLYVDSAPAEEMCGLLIYTAAGDAEGTLGGLVRMGDPNHLDHLLVRALERARWCSADPVCMEMGASGGQGPDSCNLAACHNCALVPETACEEFNRFLDRALLIGDAVTGVQGYFEDWR